MSGGLITAKGTRVRFWAGLREGEGRTGTISYAGVYACGDTPGVYIRGDDGRAVGFVALTHVEMFCPRDASAKEAS